MTYRVAEATEYRTGVVSIDGGLAHVASYLPSSRWNGFLAAPAFDAWSVVAIFEEVNANSEDGDGVDYSFDDDGVLFVTDRQYRREYPDDYETEAIAPDEDGLYTAGAFGWCWYEDDGVDMVVAMIRHEFGDMRAEFCSDPGGFLAYSGRFANVLDEDAATAIRVVVTDWAGI